MHGSSNGARYDYPLSILPKDTTVKLSRLDCGALVTFPDAEVSDNCKTIISQISGGRSGSFFRAGNHLITFQAADFSSNMSRCTFKIKVLDHPTTGTLICRSSLTVTLDQLCQAPILPKDLLIGTDYRCLERYQIRLTLSNVALPDNILRAEQIGKIIVGRVIDSVSQNSCTTNIRVVDNAPPVVEAAKDTIIPCAIANILDAPPPSALNQPRIVNECLTTTMSYADIPYTLPCNFDTRRPPFGFPDYVPYDSIKAKNCVRIVWRTFYIEDAARNLTVSFQVIYIKRADFSQIICPPQALTIRCDNGLPLNILPDTAFISGRKIPGTGRPRLSENSILPQNACGFSANYTDEITRKDEGSYTIRRRWLISGGCTNALDSCIQIISVEDLRPVLSCKTANFAINSTKIARFGVSQLIENVSDKCTPREKLTLGMRRAGQGSGFPNDTILTYGCSQLGTQSIEIWVRDEAGFTAVCTTSVRIEDPTNACFVPPPPPPPPPPPVTTPLSISGTVAAPNSRTFKADLTLTNTATNASFTQNNTAFNFADVARNQNYRLQASRKGDWRNGLTTADIAILMQHILDTEPLTSPYQLVAADVDGNGSIDVADAFSLRQLALRRIDSVPGSKSWFFIPKKYVFPPN
ncbi:MAG: HYR domain-containing protein, partial [Saprospiraceae bacterium]|nr:HYR domain-containing protein [Saprospiraceae bacterium]